eukprot:TRINITY_DN329_c0_g1_i8.p2 TRINITY_DN329_c0_g1~~TRINITY_DN329_c0_g1_i8.p2  ORF type:complete len:316 (-),score=26.85 TRINITY_DN329_c0_g1_i8:593-1540(-)
MLLNFGRTHYASLNLLLAYHYLQLQKKKKKKQNLFNFTSFNFVTYYKFLVNFTLTMSKLASSFAIQVVLIIWVQVQGVPPSDYYDSYGPNQLYVDEGESVRTTSGKDFLSGVTKDNCAEACRRIDMKCKCCDSFSFKPQGGICYLKNRGNAGEEIYSSSNGCQSFKYWGSTALGYRSEQGGDLPEYATFSNGGAQQYYIPYDVVYVANELGQVAHNEGETLEIFDGRNFIENTSSAKCADECQKLDACQGFSYNPGQKRCYLKTNMVNKYDTKESIDGWTTYWREAGQDKEKAFEKCFCPCESDFACLANDLLIV